MPKLIRRLLFTLLILVFLAWQISVPKVKAVVSACTASVSPTSIVKSSSGRLYFTISNTDSVSYVWVKITAPGSGFTVTSGSATGWSAGTTSTTVTYTSGSLAAGSNAQFLVDASTGSNSVSSQNWTVQVADDSGGASAYTCSGSPGVAITDTPPDEVAPAISSITLSDLSNSSVKITWTTDESATSVVNYGTSDSYGSTKSDSSYVTSHSVEITGLSANTTYHYQIQSADSTGNTGDFGDATFVTAKAGTTTTTTTTVTTTKTVTKIVEDTTPPGITLKTDFDKIYTEAPIVEGTATDNIGVTKVEYSLDDGKNWLPVDYQSAIGGKSITFYFTPEITDDGNYGVKARVTDPSGNKSSSKSYTLIIDRLPPQVGGQLISLGPLVLTPGDDGVVVLLSGLDHLLTLSSVGGAESIEISANNKRTALTKNNETGLWSGVLNFSKPGSYTLKANSVDGADNQTERTLTSVYVVENGRVTDGQSPIKDATVILYVFEPVSQTFILWNGESYGQANPQNVAGDGHYVLFPPAGRYYVEVSAPGYYRETSAIFTLSQPTPIVTDFTLKKAPTVSLGPWLFTLPNWRGLTGQTPEIRIQRPVIADKIKSTAEILEKELPVIDLPGETGVVSTLDLTGKPVVVTFLTSWLPQTSEQLSILSQVAQNTQLRIVPVMVQEPLQKTLMLARGGHYELSVLADPDGLLVEPLNIQTLPTHLFLNRKGIVKRVKFGVMTGEEILDNVVN